MSAPRLNGPTANAVLYYLSVNKSAHPDSIAQVLGLHWQTMRRVMNILLDAKKVHIVGWRTELTGPHSPIYAKGDGPSVPYPITTDKITKARKQREKRRRLKARRISLSVLEIQPPTIGAESK